MTGYGTVLDTPRLLLALHRGDLTAVEWLLGEPAVRARTGSTSARWPHDLDGLAALGERESGRARGRSRPPAGDLSGALRASRAGLVRETRALIGQAGDRFDAFGLAWHASQTRALA